MSHHTFFIFEIDYRQASVTPIVRIARVVELVDTQVSEACGATHGSSSLPPSILVSFEIILRRAPPHAP